MTSLADSDLLWLFNESPGELGMKALSLEPGFGGVSDHDGISDDQVDAASRRARIVEALSGLDPSDQRALRLAHQQVGPAVRIRFAQLGELAPVMVDLHGAEAMTAAMHLLGTRSAKTREQREAARDFVDRAQRDAASRVARAVARYREAKQAARSARRAEMLERWERQSFETRLVLEG